MNEINEPTPPAADASHLQPPPRRKRRRWVRFLVMLIVFTAGVVIGLGMGVVGTIKGVQKNLQHAVHHPEEAPRRVTRRLTKKLDLSEAQAEEVLAIVTDQQQDFLAIRREVQPRVEAELDETYNRISEILDGRQKVEWKKLYNDLREKWLPQPPAVSPVDPPAATQSSGPPER